MPSKFSISTSAFSERYLGLQGFDNNKIYEITKLSHRVTSVKDQNFLIIHATADGIYFSLPFSIFHEMPGENNASPLSDLISLARKVSIVDQGPDNDIAVGSQGSTFDEMGHVQTVDAAAVVAAGDSVVPELELDGVVSEMLESSVVMPDFAFVVAAAAAAAAAFVASAAAGVVAVEVVAAAGADAVTAEGFAAEAAIAAAAAAAGDAVAIDATAAAETAWVVGADAFVAGSVSVGKGRAAVAAAAAAAAEETGADGLAAVVQTDAAAVGKVVGESEPVAAGTVAATAGAAGLGDARDGDAAAAAAAAEAGDAEAEAAALSVHNQMSTFFIEAQMAIPTIKCNQSPQHIPVFRGNLSKKI
ncbi:hypothetical protein E2320_001567 [Naja naja]|nr:hypothetical protein E2320_001567 [Naja naja]